jgi:hypothetical protein
LAVNILKNKNSYILETNFGAYSIAVSSISSDNIEILYLLEIAYIYLLLSNYNK